MRPLLAGAMLRKRRTPPAIAPAEAPLQVTAPSRTLVGEPTRRHPAFRAPQLGLYPAVRWNALNSHDGIDETIVR
jgi:hypothetical protein